MFQVLVKDWFGQLRLDSTRLDD